MKKLLKTLVLCGILFPASGIRAQNTYTNPVMDFDMPRPAATSSAMPSTLPRSPP